MRLPGAVAGGQGEAGVKRRRSRWTYAAAAVVFGLATWYAVAGIDVSPSDVRWEVVALLVGVAVPATTVLNGQEYRVTAQLLGQQHSFAVGFRISVLGSAANIMPVPGAVLVRGAAMRLGGATYGQASTALLIAGVSWGGATGVFSGVLLLISGRYAIGLLALGAGVAGWALAYALLRWRLPTASLRVWLRLLVVELLTVAAGAIRFLLVIVAVGKPVELSQAAALTVAGAVAAATGIFPGGLGLREALAGLIGPLVALPAQVALLSAVGNRIAEYVVLGPAALLLARTGSGPATSVGVEADDQVREQAGHDDLQ